MWSFSVNRYRSVKTTPEDDASSEISDLPRQPKTASRCLKERKTWLLSLQLVLFSANLVLFVFSMFTIHRQVSPIQQPGVDGGDAYRRLGFNDKLKETSSFSPIFDVVDLRPRLHTLNGALRDNTSIWRQPPSATVDAAWDYISTEGLEAITVSSDALSKSHKDPSLCVKAPPSWGAGSDAYIAQIEVFHQIHCLNELRKEIYYDHYYKSPPSELHRSHKSHCIDMLLQALTCAADVGVISHNWVHNEHITEPKTRPMADFNVVKKCRDFDRLLDWARENAVKDLAKKWPKLKYPGDVPVVPGDGYA